MRALLVVSIVAVALAGACTEPHAGRARARGPAAVWVSNEGDGTVAGIDPETDAVVARVRVGTAPRSLVLSPDGRWLYVSVGGGPAAEGVAVVDVRRHALAHTLKCGDTPGDLALSPDGRRLFVTNERSARMTAIDTESGRVAGTVDIGGGPEHVAVSPGGHTVWIASEHDGLVSVVDTETLGAIAVLDTGTVPRAVAFSPDGSRAYLAAGRSLRVIDAGAFMPSGDIPLPRPASALTSRAGLLFAASPSAIDAVDAAGRRLQRRVSHAGAVSVAFAHGKLYAVDGKEVLVIDTATGTVAARIKTGAAPRHVTAL